MIRMRWLGARVDHPMNRLSPLCALVLFTTAPYLIPALEAADVVINEIHYDPADSTSRAEFIELHNPGPVRSISPGGASRTAWTSASLLATRSTPVDTWSLRRIRQPSARCSESRRSAPGLGGSMARARRSRCAIPPAGSSMSSATKSASRGRSHPPAMVDRWSCFTRPWTTISGVPGEYRAPQMISPRRPCSPWNLQRGAGAPVTPKPHLRSRRGGRRRSPRTIRGAWMSRRPIGYGRVNGVTFNTTITGMSGNYGCLFLRNSFTVLPGEMPASLQLRSTSDDGIIVWINGIEVGRRRFIGDPRISDFASSSPEVEGEFESSTIENPAGFSSRGRTPSRCSCSTRPSGERSRFRPRSSSAPPPGSRHRSRRPARATRYFSNAVAPNIRQVDHSPQEPAASQPVLITAKVTDPQGVASVHLLYQIVAPGQFIPARIPRTVAQILADPEGAAPGESRLRGSGELDDAARW